MLVAKFIQEIFLLENFLQETFANALKGHQSKCQVKAVTTLYLVQHNIKYDIELTAVRPSQSQVCFCKMSSGFAE